MSEVKVNENMRLEEGNHLGLCRAIHEPNSFCLLPKAFSVSGPLPEWQGVKAYFLATPALGASFIECKLSIAAGGGTKEPLRLPCENYMYVLDGSVELVIAGKKHILEPKGFFWAPPSAEFSVKNRGADEATLLWVRKKYKPTKFEPVPDILVSSVSDIPAVQTNAERIQECLPESNLGYDMAINIMTFDPGVSFPCTEIHVFEHGEYFLNGRGHLWVNGRYLEVTQDDFCYIAAFAPHFVVAYGPEPLSYMLFKDLSRDYEL
ncbi:MAG: cupin domain-containing protein [Clostridiales Family XIII bacterium]|jgi:(S)-ureidoglycine aminohydrolase|nr:cupin domain-containing protein [Clostridiales Family XIII bacterium]